MVNCDRKRLCVSIGLRQSLLTVLNQHGCIVEHGVSQGVFFAVDRAERFFADSAHGIFKD